MGAEGRQRTSRRGCWEWTLDQWEEGLWETQGGCNPKSSGQGRLGNKDLKERSWGVSQRKLLGQRQPVSRPWGGRTSPGPAVAGGPGAGAGEGRRGLTEMTGPHSGHGSPRGPERARAVRPSVSGLQGRNCRETLGGRAGALARARQGRGRKGPFASETDHIHQM